MTESPAWPAIPEAEMEAFYATADAYLQAANGLVGEEPTERIAAAFLYAGARFLAFSMQAQTDALIIGDNVRDALMDRFEEELRDHMLQQLRQATAAPAMPGQVPDAALDVLMSMNDMDADARTLFLRLGDRFIHIANDMIEQMPIARVSAAMMHACTRFNAYVMQARGLQPGPLDEAIVADFRSIFRSLLDFHLGQSVVTDREG